jgi:mannose-1-phosphate guanylyltransferase/mannose-6-phosphate isomerase
MLLQPVILSGGSGSRLWPLSREAYPKQFLPLTSEHTMLQETARRVDGLVSEYPNLGIESRAPIVVCNQAHRFLVAEQFRVMERDPAAIVLEPLGRNTAPALTLAALVATRPKDGEVADPVLLAMPADHVIANEPAFRAAVADGLQLAAGGAVVTFGVVPDKPETGYGYLRQGALLEDQSGLNGRAFALKAFVEKPDAEQAQAYLASGEYLWNSGIFMLKASLWLALMERFRADILAAVRAALPDEAAPEDFVGVSVEAFTACPSDSIDYAVMEPLCARHGEGDPPVLVLPLDVGWSDVGAWSALWEVRDRDEQGNVLDGDAFAHESRNNLLLAQHRMLAAVGVEDLIVVETADAVLVAHKDHAQDVKAVTQFLSSQKRNEHRDHQRVHRPWGSFSGIDRGARYQVKRLSVKPGHSLSLQMHHHRAEHWIVVSGTAKVTCDDRVQLLTENQSTYIPVGARHRLENPGTIPLEIIEVQSGSYLGEDDIVRFEDVYRRTEERG